MMRKREDKKMTKQRKIDHINLMVPDMEKALAYYTEVLGYKITGRYINGGKDFAFLTDGNETFEFLEDKEITKSVMDHIAYAVEDIKVEYEYFQSIDSELLLTEIGFVPFLFENGMHYFFIKGANGERIEFCQRA